MKVDIPVQSEINLRKSIVCLVQTLLFCSVAVGFSLPVFAEKCEYKKTKSMMIADGLYPTAVIGSVFGDCADPTMSLIVKYNSHMSKEEIYKVSAHPKTFFGFSLRRATPKQLYGMIDNLLKVFVRPKKVTDLKGKSNCKLKVSDSYIDTLIKKDQWAHPISYDNSSYNYIAYVSELDRYVEIATCEVERTIDDDKKGVAADPAGKQHFLSESMKKWENHEDCDKEVAKYDFESISKKFENASFEKYSEQYRNQKCNILPGVLFTTSMSKSDVCILQSYLCDKIKGYEAPILYCVAESKKECFEKEKWQLTNPAFDSFRGIRFRAAFTKEVKENDKFKTKTCIYWN
ncbi:hypothetical protein [Teredinibacter sp. KSP-S5-2]|uniref:hypothetical protein n=1 Tax=Teredinibacter sp. KSP-S5-2 TaxID=3034506 RepID=UPI0029346731|nr:hypothetical protein [Teredinibacter sp. KSP-S5-2]WNO09022.1 hypothetical protein P5V12_18935 [Teredinibacter sp. KSP-S5-2]